MSNIILRPDLKTAGGEVSDILYNDQFVGALSIVFREGHRLSGAVQLEQSTLSDEWKSEIEDFVETYIQNLIAALNVEEGEVVLTYSSYDHIIGTETEVEETVLLDDEKEDFLESEIAEDPEGVDETDFYELVIVGESRNHVDYHVYSMDQKWIAEGMMTIQGFHVSGDVHWMVNPLEEELDLVLELIVSDFEDMDVETFSIQMLYEDQLIETIELTHNDLLDDAENAKENDYTVVLSRNDGDVLSYEIYQQSHGGLPIGTATIDISSRNVTGFINFRETNCYENTEKISSILMQELDKEKEYTSFHVTMLCQNEPMDEMHFTNETIEPSASIH